MKKLFLLALSVVLFASCSATHKTMKNPDSRIEFNKSDFTVTGQASASASSTRILGIDWENLFEKKKFGDVDQQVSSMTPVSAASVPVVGGVLTNATSGLFGGILGIFIDNTAEIATHNLITKNSDNDVVLYPRYQTTTSKPILGIGFIFKKTQVTVTARLGRLNE
ncbi:MAG: hypothetical protein ACPG6A_04640 [Flavobacteriaceae bacterium]|tara:strand:- start:655 stop:1152 length:498 start_codon:yes stop_codon:yes gene_type:complete